LPYGKHQIRQDDITGQFRKLRAKAIRRKQAKPEIDTPDKNAVHIVFAGIPYAIFEIKVMDDHKCIV